MSHNWLGALLVYLFVILLALLVWWLIPVSHTGLPISH